MTGRAFVVTGDHRSFLYTCGREGLSPTARDVIEVTPGTVEAGRLWGLRREEGDRIVYGFMGFASMVNVWTTLRILGFSREEVYG